MLAMLSGGLKEVQKKLLLRRRFELRFKKNLIACVIFLKADCRIPLWGLFIIFIH